MQRQQGPRLLWSRVGSVILVTVAGLATIGGIAGLEGAIGGALLGLLLVVLVPLLIYVENRMHPGL